MAVFSALKNKVKAAKVVKKAPAKKSAAKKVAKKAPDKKAPAKKVAAKPAKKAVLKPVKPVKPVKVALKKDLTAKEVQQLVNLKNDVARHKEIVETLAASGIDNYRKAVKKEFLALAQEARHLDEVIATNSEKARKAGLGTSARILSKAQLALIAQPQAPVDAAPANLTSAKSEGKAPKAAIVLDDEGNEIVVEEVELEDVETLIAEVAEIIDTEAEDKSNQPRVVNLAEEASGNEENAFTLKASEEDDAPAQTVMTAGATADPVKDYLKQIGRVALLNAELEVELATRMEAGLFAEEKLATEKKIEDQGAEVETGTPDQLKAFVKKEAAHWKAVVTAAKLQVE